MEDPPFFSFEDTKHLAVEEDKKRPHTHTVYVAAFTVGVFVVHGCDLWKNTIIVFVVKQLYKNT